MYISTSLFVRLDLYNHGGFTASQKQRNKTAYVCIVSLLCHLQQWYWRCYARPTHAYTR